MDNLFIVFAYVFAPVLFLIMHKITELSNKRHLESIRSLVNLMEDIHKRQSDLVDKVLEDKEDGDGGRLD